MGLISTLSKRIATWSVPPAAAGSPELQPRRSLAPTTPSTTAGHKDLQTELTEIASLRLKIASRRTRNDADRRLVSGLYKLLQTRCFDAFRPTEEVLRIQDATRDPLGDIGRLSLALKREAEIGGRILAIARATAAKGSSVRDVRDAVLRVGPAQTGALFTAFLLRPRFFTSPVNPEGAQVRFHHAIATALSLQVIAERAGLDRDAVFLVGLLHDAGEAVIESQLSEVSRSLGNMSGPDAETIRFLHSELHAIFGALVADAWRLPRPQIEAILHHENPAASQPDGRRLAYAVALADRIAEEIKPTGVARTDSPGTLITSAFSVLKITGIQEIAAECRQAVETFDASEPAARASLMPRPATPPRPSLMPIRASIALGPKRTLPPSEPPPPPARKIDRAA